MLIATLPTIRSNTDLAKAEIILSNPLIGAARYNTGGATPLSPSEVIAQLTPIAAKHKKKLYIDLEGRQVRVARWTPQSRGEVTLNCDFSITLPARIHFRRVGWFEVVAAVPRARKIFFIPRWSKNEYFLGESQSVHIVASDFSVNGYLKEQDHEYIKAAIQRGINTFMLSFVEDTLDLEEFREVFFTARRNSLDDPTLQSEVILKIESLKGIEWVKNQFDTVKMPWARLMSARDDLFLGFVNKRRNILAALKLIVEKDPQAIVASRLLSGLEWFGEVTLADLTDIVLMRQFGYQNFMLSDELSEYFPQAMAAWEADIAPLLTKPEG